MFFKTLPLGFLSTLCLLGGCTTTPVYQEVNIPSIHTVAQEINHANNYVYEEISK